MRGFLPLAIARRVPWPGQECLCGWSIALNAFRQGFNQIGARLSGLGLVSKLLVAALIVVAVLAMVLVATSSSRSTLVELMPGLAVDQQSRAKTMMDQMGIRYKAEGGKLMVPPEQRYGVLAVLQENGSLGGEQVILFSNLGKHQNWMNTKSQNDTIERIALQNELSGIIGSMKGIKRAVVVINLPEVTGMGSATIRPTASVAIETDGSQPMDNTRATAIASLVAGAARGLKPQDVTVVDKTTGRTFRIRADGALDSSDYLEAVGKYEATVREKLQESLSYIPGVLVSVTAQVDNTRRSYTEKKVFADGQGSVTAPIRTEKTTKNDTQPGPAAEPGARLNVGTSLADGQGGGARTEETTQTSESRFEPGSRVETVTDGRGNATKLTAVISLPHEYLSVLVRRTKATAGGAAGAGAAAGNAGGDAASEEPTEQEIVSKFAEEKARLEADLGPLMAAAVTAVSDGAEATPTRVLTVSRIPVPTLGLGGSAASAGFASIGGGSSGGSGSAAGSGAGLGSYLTPDTIRTVILGGFAVLAVGMMLTLVKKASRPLELPSAEQIAGVPPSLETDADIVGEADESLMAMEGVELPDEQVKGKRMLEQVQEMVSKKPSDAAALLNLWLTPEQ